MPSPPPEAPAPRALPTMPSLESPMMIVRRRLRSSGLLLFVAASLGADAPAPAHRLTYERHVRPILRTHCFQCHGEEAKPKAGLDLRLVRLMRRGGESGEAIVPGQHAESLLWERLEADEMPPGDK